MKKYISQCSCYLLLYNKLHQITVAYKSNHFIITPNTVIWRGLDWVIYLVLPVITYVATSSWKVDRALDSATTPENWASISLRGIWMSPLHVASPHGLSGSYRAAQAFQEDRSCQAFFRLRPRIGTASLPSHSIDHLQAPPIVNKSWQPRGMNTKKHGSSRTTKVIDCHRILFDTREINLTHASLSLKGKGWGRICWLL